MSVIFYDYYNHVSNVSACKYRFYSLSVVVVVVAGDSIFIRDFSFSSITL